MNPMNSRQVQHCLSKMDDLYVEASRALSGWVDATIHGRYFGDHLPDDEFEKLRDIALRHVARQYWTEMQNLKMVHGVPVEFEGWKVDTIDKLMAYWKHLQPPVRKSK